MLRADFDLSGQTAAMHSVCPACREMSTTIHRHTKELARNANTLAQLAKAHIAHDQFERLLARNAHLTSEIASLKLEKKLHEQTHTWRTAPA